MELEEIVKTYQIGEQKLELVGYYDEEKTPKGEHDWFDLFVVETGECINEGEPLYSIPTKTQVKKMYDEFLGNI